MADRPLTNKQRIFAEGITRGLSGVQAAMQAGYKGNDNVLAQIGHKMVRNGKVKAVIDKRCAEIEAETDYNVKKWREDTREARKLANESKNYSAVAAFDRLLGQHMGVFELDNKQKAEQRQLTEKEAEHARRLANIMLREGTSAAAG